MQIYPAALPLPCWWLCSHLFLLRPSGYCYNTAFCFMVTAYCHDIFFRCYYIEFCSLITEYSIARSQHPLTRSHHLVAMTAVCCYVQHSTAGVQHSSHTSQHHVALSQHLIKRSQLYHAIVSDCCVPVEQQYLKAYNCHDLSGQLTSCGVSGSGVGRRWKDGVDAPFRGAGWTTAVSAGLGRSSHSPAPTSQAGYKLDIT